MCIFFFIPLTLIAFYESTSDNRKYVWMGDWFRGDDEARQECPKNRDPKVNDPNCEGMKISKVPLRSCWNFPRSIRLALTLYFFMMFFVVNWYYLLGTVKFKPSIHF